MTVDITFHYPPELMNLLIDTIPLLNKGKKDMFLFFKGAGVSDNMMRPSFEQWQRDKDSIGKHEIARQVLTEMNARDEGCLRHRREILKRVVEFENFSACWESDQLKAKGLVSEIRQVVNIKDSFTRMAQERDAERRQHQARVQAEKEALQKRKAEMAEIQKDLCRLFAKTNPQKRGKALEGILNRLFKAQGISIREAFTLTGNEGEGIVEQIDGVVELDGHLYFVEMKWWEKALGKLEVSEHLMRVFFRAESRAIILSYSGFTEAAIATCREALQKKVVVLCTLEEVVAILEQGSDLRDLLKKKVQGAIVDKNPFVVCKLPPRTVW